MVAWAWIPITVWAALAQTMRNAAQRHLVKEVGTLGATLVRFLYGLPFAIAWLILLSAWTREATPPPNFAFAGWVIVSAVSQMAATALLLRVMAGRNFALGVAYSKTEILQVAVFGLLFLGDPITLPAAAAIGIATAGLLLISSPPGKTPLVALLQGWTRPTALLGLASGATFALAAVGYRGAALSLTGAGAAMAAADTLVWAQALQSLLLGGWLLARNPAAITGVLREWRTSLAAGFMGAAASAGWFTAMAVEPVAHVRTLGLVEMLFSYTVSHRLFHEQLRGPEAAGYLLLTLGILAITVAR
jgi:drug/metabolite transporter (DMT)-like permease